MSLKFYEALKSILSDVESFLVTSLKDVRLSSSTAAEKESILQKLRKLQDEFPQLRQPEPEPAAKKADQPEFRTKPNSVSSPSSASLEAGTASPPTVPAADAMSNGSMSGFLTPKNPSKGKMNIMSMLPFGRGKNFCIITGGIFYMYDKPSSKKQCGSFPIRGYEARMSSEQPSKKEFSFDLVNPGQKSYVFAAPTKGEMEKWVSVLNEESLKNPDPRMSVFFESAGKDDSSSIGEDYEEPESPVAPVSKSKNKSASLPVLDHDSDELYDDVGAPPGADEDGQEEYADAEQKTDEDSLIYESFDDYTAPEEPKPPEVPPARTVGMPTVKETVVSGNGNDYENMYYGKWDCSSDGDNELAFKRGDIVLILSREYDNFGWWIARLNGTVGLVPRDYLTPAYELISG